MRVLIVEDNPVDLKLMVAVLLASGHVVAERNSALGALDAAQAERPDLILLDLQLPDLDGMSLVHELRRNPDTRSIPIVAVTAYPGRFDHSAVLKAGCVACLTKPIDTRQLAGTLSRFARPEASP